MKADGQAIADIRRAILVGFEHSPVDLKLAVDEASIGKTWNNITYGITGLDGSIDAVVQFAAQQGKLAILLTTLADKYNPALGPQLKQLAQTVKPIFDEAETLGIAPQKLESVLLSDVEFQDAGIWINKLSKTRHAVCCVEFDVKGARVFGTGFLVARNVVMTCNHVVTSFWNDPQAGHRVVFRFGYEKRADDSVGSEIVYKLASDWRILARESPDFALLRVEPAERDETQRQPITLTTDGLQRDRPLIIFQHPKGNPLKVLVGEIASIDGNRVRYVINTEGGSSGSPCLNSKLQAVAIHYAGGNYGYSMKAVLSEIDKASTQAELSSQQRQVLQGLVKHSYSETKTEEQETLLDDEKEPHARVSDETIAGLVKDKGDKLKQCEAVQDATHLGGKSLKEVVKAYILAETV
ncbi:MAG: serine protease, partial [Planctomycetota bacterium]